MEEILAAITALGRGAGQPAFARLLRWRLRRLFSS
jgi:hypothetical protein